jgi:SAM-dependent methyltransferase
MRSLVESGGRRFARVATRAVVARPSLWRFFRRPVRRQFGSLAPSWEGRGGEEALMPLGAALDRVAGPPPREVLDLGTGTGKAARLVAERFPGSRVVGIDLAPEMVEESRRLLPAELRGRLTFMVADASRLPFEDSAFDLVVLQNAIPFFVELARVTAPGGHVLFAFSYGALTPIFVPPQTLRTELAKVGFGDFQELAAGNGLALLAAREVPG